MSEDSVRRSHRGSIGWNIVGFVEGLAVIFVVIVASGLTLFASRPGTGAPYETADQSVTSGPRHSTPERGDMPSESQDESVANVGSSISNPRLRSHLWHRDEHS